MFTPLRGSGASGPSDVSGVSGGTVALVLGIYERLVHNVHAGAQVLKELVRGRREAALLAFRRVEWVWLLSLLGGVLADRLPKRRRVQARHRVKRRREEALHVGSPEPKELSVSLSQRKRVIRPALGVVGHGVGVAREHEPPLPRTEGGDEVGLAAIGIDRENLQVKTHAFQPPGQQVDHGAIAVIPGWIRGTDGGRCHQLPELVDNNFFGLHGFSLDKGPPGAKGQRKSQ